MRGWRPCSVVWLAFVTLILSSSLQAGETSYEQQLKAMGHLLFQCSSHNLIFGLELERTQIERLYEMARLVDALSPPPVITASPATDLSPTVRVFQRLEDALRRRTAIPESFRQELLATRRQQASLLRKGLRYDTSQMPLSCVRCHWVPGSRKWLALPWIDQVANHPGIRKEQAIAHTVAPFGLIGFAVVAWYSREIDGLLTLSQKAALGTFSCCLLPPRDFADPLRVGQAELGGWEIDVLQKLRSASRWTLPLFKFGFKSALRKGFKALHPGATSRQLSEVDERVEKMTTKVRDLSDVDFELQKETLAKELSLQKTDATTEAARKFKQAMFLLIPGSSALYRDLWSGPVGP